MKELELKYGCNPNQKPSRIYMENGELPAISTDSNLSLNIDLPISSALPFFYKIAVQLIAVK